MVVGSGITSIGLCRWGCWQEWFDAAAVSPAVVAVVWRVVRGVVTRSWDRSDQCGGVLAAAVTWSVEGAVGGW